MDNPILTGAQTLKNTASKPDMSIWRYSTALILFTLVSFGIGFYTGRNFNNSDSQVLTAPSQQVESNSLIESLPTTTILGKITEVNGKTLSVTNNKGINGNIEASENLVIIKPTVSGAISGSDLNSIELNKDAALSVQINAGRYEVISIVYPPSPVPPTSTPSAQLKSAK